MSLILYKQPGAQPDTGPVQSSHPVTHDSACRGTETTDIGLVYNINEIFLHLVSCHLQINVVYDR